MSQPEPQVTACDVCEKPCATDNLTVTAGIVDHNAVPHGLVDVCPECLGEAETCDGCGTPFLDGSTVCVMCNYRHVRDTV